MGFGNPYGDPYELDFVYEFIAKLKAIDVEIISLSDTIGVSNPTNIKALFEGITKTFDAIEFGVHLHSDLDTAVEKIAAAYKAGCRRFDGAINGFGGCPMAEDKLVGNIATETMINYFKAHNIPLTMDDQAFQLALNMAPEVFLGR